LFRAILLRYACKKRTPSSPEVVSKQLGDWELESPFEIIQADFLWKTI